MKGNDHAMAIAGIAFGVFCLFAVIVGVIYILSITSQQPAITDTYGNTASPETNTSEKVVSDVTDTSGNAIVPLVIIGGVVLLIAVIIGLWIASKSGGWG